MLPPLVAIDDRDYQVPFPFTSTLEKLTIKLGPKMPPPEIMEMEKKLLERASSGRAGDEAGEPATAAPWHRWFRTR
jgi:hypothetical protein